MLVTRLLLQTQSSRPPPSSLLSLWVRLRCVSRAPPPSVSPGGSGSAHSSLLLVPGALGTGTHPCWSVITHEWVTPVSPPQLYGGLQTLTGNTYQSFHRGAELTSPPRTWLPWDMPRRAQHQRGMLRPDLGGFHALGLLLLGPLPLCPGNKAGPTCR